MPCCHACKGRRPVGGAIRSAAGAAAPAAAARACVAGRTSVAHWRSGARADAPAAGACFNERPGAWSAVGRAAQTANTPQPAAQPVPPEQGADALNRTRLARVMQRRSKHAPPARTGKPGPGGSSAAGPEAPPQLQQQPAHAADNGRSRGPGSAPLRREPPAPARRLPAQQLLAFEREGHTCTRRLLPADVVGELARLVAREVCAALLPGLVGPLKKKRALCELKSGECLLCGNWKMRTRGQMLCAWG